MDKVKESQDEDLRPERVSNSVVVIRTLEEAEQYGVPVISPIRTDDFQFILRKTSHPDSHLSDKAKEQLFLDALHLEKTWLKRKLDGFREDEFTASQSVKTAFQYNGKLLAEHYQVHPSTVTRVVALGRKTSTTDTRPRSGRPPVFNRVHQQHALKTNNEVSGGSLRTLQALLEASPPTEYETSYKGVKRHSPCFKTIWSLLQQEKLVIQTIRFRPLLSEANQKERLKWSQEKLFTSVRGLDIEDGDAREAFVRHLETLVDVDECYLVYCVGTGKLYFLPEDFEKLKQDGGNVSTVIMDEWKKNPPKILLFGAITAPRLVNPRTSHMEGAKFDERQKGIVQIRRVRAMSRYQRKTKVHKRHDLKFSDCSINGAVYEYMMTGPNGLSDFMDKYYADSDNEEEDDQVRTTAWGIPIELTSDHRKKKAPESAAATTTTATTTTTTATSSSSAALTPTSHPIKVQQDNAGGHGFNNLQGGKPTEYQLRMVKEMSKRKY
jgi:hypothetical protein